MIVLEDASSLPADPGIQCEEKAEIFKHVGRDMPPPIQS